jgi:hypothetical protein
VQSMDAAAVAKQCPAGKPANNASVAEACKPYGADVAEVLFTKEQIAEAVARLGSEVSRDYADKAPLIMPILKVRRMHPPPLPSSPSRPSLPATPRAAAHPGCCRAASSWQPTWCVPWTPALRAWPWSL